MKCQFFFWQTFLSGTEIQNKHFVNFYERYEPVAILDCFSKKMDRRKEKLWWVNLTTVTMPSLPYEADEIFASEYFYFTSEQLYWPTGSLKQLDIAKTADSIDASSPFFEPCKSLRNQQSILSHQNRERRYLWSLTWE